MKITKTEYRVCRPSFNWIEIVRVNTKSSAYIKAKYFANRYQEEIIVAWLKDGKTRTKTFKPSKG